MEKWLPEDSYARLTTTVETEGIAEILIRQRLSAQGIEIINTNVRAAQGTRCYTLNIREQRRYSALQPHQSLMSWKGSPASSLSTGNDHINRASARGF